MDYLASAARSTATSCPLYLLPAVFSLSNVLFSHGEGESACRVVLACKLLKILLFHFFNAIYLNTLAGFRC